MRILHIDTGLGMRGGQELLMLGARGLRARGHEQTIACPLNSPLQQAAAAEGYPILSLPTRDRYYVGSAFRIRRFLRGHACEIVHAHDARGQTLSWIATAGLPVCRVANRLVTFEPRNLPFHRWKYSRSCHGVIALSPAVRDTLVRNGIPEGRIEVIVGGIEFPEQLPDPGARSRMREAWGLGAEDFVVGHVAAFTAEKGQDTALEALLRLLPALPNLRMLLVGDGPLRRDPAVLEKVRLAQGCAQLPGYLKPSAEFYAGLDLFLINSTSEALGLSAIYAMAYGVPVIATHVGGLPGVVAAGETGWLIPPGDSAALAGAIAEAASDPGRLRRFGLQGRERARLFSSSITAERTEALYDRLLRECSHPPSSGTAGKSQISSRTSRV
jgi:glycosyltransferase involved in cell wall biosynthesis